MSDTRFGYVEQESIMTFTIWSFLAYLGFILPWLMMSKKQIRLIKHLDIKVEFVKNFKYIYIVYILFAVLFFGDSIKQASSYEGNVLLSENSFYKYFIDIGSLILTYSIAVYAFNKRWVKAGILLFILFIWSLYSSDKNPLFLGVIGFLCGYNSTYKKKMYSFKMLLICLLSVPVLALLFNSYRSGKLNMFNINKSLYSNSDPRGPFRSVISTEEDYENGTIDFIYGESYLNSFVMWIPGFIWKDRPEDMAVKYAKKNISNYTKGVGLGYSPLAEGVKNFGYLGPFFHYIIVSFSILMMYIWFTKSNRKNEVIFMFYIFLVTFISLMPRTPYNLPASVVRFLIPMLLIVRVRKFIMK